MRHFSLRSFRRQLLVSALSAFMLHAVVAVLGSALAADGTADTIPWKDGATFTRTSVDDDIRSVLRLLLSTNGQSVIFRPGIDAKVSFAFKAIPAQVAFKQLIDEHGLKYSYNPGTQTVTIYPAAGAQAGGEARRFIALQNVDIATVRQALTSFGLGTDGVAFDQATSTIGLRGDDARIAQVADLVKTLEDRAGVRKAAENEDRQRAAASGPSSIEKLAAQGAANVQTKVIRLRFADVGPSTRQFHGRSVTIPGILETLQAMLGQGSATPFQTESRASTGFRGALPVDPATRLGLRPPAPASAPAAAPAPDTGATGPGISPDITIGMLQGMNKPTISIDQRTNSVVVRGTPAAIAAVEEVVRQLDQPVKMVEIEVVIATAQVGVAEELGISYRGEALSNGRARTGFGFDTGTSGTQIAPTSAFDPVTLLPAASATGAPVASFVLRGSQVLLQTQLRLLAGENKARVLSAPHLVTLDNVTARITHSQDIYVPVDTGGLNGQGLSQIQTGLTLEITPSVVPTTAGGQDSLVRLSLNATNSSPGTGSTGQIDVNAQEVQTDVLVPDGGTFVIGGLFDDSRLKGTNGIPVLKNIPILGHLFRDDTSSQNLGETIFFITPHIVDQQQMVRRDVAAIAPTANYIQEQRRLLGTVSQSLQNESAPTGNIAKLEEDE